jgi:hypothetical protein
MNPILKNHVVKGKIQSLDQLKEELHEAPSVYSGYLSRVLSSSFVLGMPFRTVQNLDLYSIRPKRNRIRSTVKKISIPVLFFIFSSCSPPDEVKRPEIREKTVYFHPKVKDWNSEETSIKKRIWLEKVNNFKK